ncbi:2082_t:CDS:2 [Paraglomus occultum]|uniref:2082_t:CDS:1 n=1 Tax=Paraglomus occultum TaxID=144539 RepID=A0A9N9ADS1_9GLOM|nr:2082_t:CDS:2 [Paraglomus occultum]
MFLKSTASRLLALCALFAATLTSQAFPNGAGTCNVNGISSGHGPSTLSGTGGFAINVKPRDITKGNFDFSLSGSQFEGILIYVVDANSKRIGSFANTQGLQFKSCDNSPQATLTHQNSNLKDPSKIVMSWSSGGSTQGNVTIQAVVVTTAQTSYYTLKQTFNLANSQGSSGAVADTTTTANTKGGNAISQFFANYTLFAVIIGIATFLYAFGAGMEVILRRQQQKAKQYAKDVTNGFAR